MNSTTNETPQLAERLRAEFADRLTAIGKEQGDLRVKHDKLAEEATRVRAAMEALK